MEFDLSRFVANINTGIYLKDPESSVLGRNILKQSIELISKLGFEEFTFKKLSQEIQSSEASVYRYFENKHKLLLYLTSFYWGWVEYQLVIKNANISNPEIRLNNAIEVLTISDEHFNSTRDQIDFKKLFVVICTESSKAFFTKGVDDLNNHGAYANYKKLVSKISDIILEIDTTYKYPHMLISTIIEGIHTQLYFAQHLPSLTDDTDGDNTVFEFYKELIFNQLKKNR